MEKKYIIGGLAILGAIALVAYIRKPKRNSDGFYSADGTVGVKSTSPCRVCEGTSSLYFAVDGRCRRGDKCRQTVKEFEMG